MTGSSDGLIRFWENEGDALSIAKRNFSCFTAFIFVPYLGKNVFWLICTQQKNIPFINRARYSELCHCVSAGTYKFSVDVEPFSLEHQNNVKNCQ
jgi:hypothetical protein